ncbi:ATP-binding protein [Thioflexithrix psekupsensis]|uniref:histidine kinase n=1 Tax=Thioflexithrix psekupsensis TaxID=1570016 RepID=A0A251X5L9_9GAMM|nr:ATP-binding protein [Thioflexithrix psekupsensis]OUD12398.1 hypothetical protein TPSD3_14910 [Thioflexithrix psekupsensis]
MQPLNVLSRIPSRFSLRVTLIAPFLVIIFIAVTLTGFLSLRHGEQAVNQLASQLRAEITARIADRLQSFIAEPQWLNQNHAYALQLNEIGLEDSTLLERHFWQYIQAFPAVYSSYYGHEENGQFHGANQYPNLPLQITRATPEDNRTMYKFKADEDGFESEELSTRPHYDPRERPWYQVAKARKKPTWSEIYADFSTKALMITAAHPIYRGDELQGVLGVDVTLSNISDFLRQLKAGKSGKTFVMERGGLLVASSSDSPPYDADNNPILATALNDTMIQAAAEFLMIHTKAFQHVDHSTQFEFTHDQETYYLQITPWETDSGLDWLIAVVLPKAEFMEQIHANMINTLILMLIFLSVAVMVGVLSSRWVTKPLRDLNAAADRIAKGEWDQHLPTARTDEIGDLARTFNTMGEQLRAHFATLEQRVAERTRELATAYKRLKSSQTQLVQSEKMASLGQMVAGVAHEINTPLGYVKNNVSMTQRLLKQAENLLQQYRELVELLLSGETDENTLQAKIAEVLELANEFFEEDTFAETDQLLKDTLYGIEQISELVVNLRNFSRLDQARIADVNMNENLDSVLTIAHNMLKHRVEVIKEYGELPPVSCSPSQLNQVFLNLITNASQAVTPGNGKVIIKTSADNDHVYVSIQDNGCGIPKEILNKIFDPFFTTKPVGEGTGLGLSISHQIVHQHGGKIKVASQQGKGTRFTVSLPRQRPKIPATSTAANPA